MIRIHTSARMAWPKGVRSDSRHPWVGNRAARELGSCVRTPRILPAESPAKTWPFPTEICPRGTRTSQRKSDGVSIWVLAWYRGKISLYFNTLDTHFESSSGTIYSQNIDNSRGTSERRSPESIRCGKRLRDLPHGVLRREHKLYNRHSIFRLMLNACCTRLPSDATLIQPLNDDPGARLICQYAGGV